MEKKFFDLDWKERKAIANKRMSGDKWIVYDYTPNRDGKFGIIEKLPKSIDKGFIHGYVLENPLALVPIGGHNHFEISVHTNNWFEDEEFENRHIYHYHVFTSLEKAQRYAEKVAEYMEKSKKLSLESILPYIRKSFADARITRGKRGYETSSSEYECIVADGGWTTFKILDERYILVQMGQGTKYIIAHTDLIEKCFTNLPEYSSINYWYCEDTYRWSNFYPKKEEHCDDSEYEKLFA
jgi:hypothetical protein